MKIAFVTRELPISSRCGGIGHYVWDMANNLQDKGHQITIIAASDDYRQSKVFIQNGIKIILLTDVDFYIGKNRFFSSLYSKVRNYIMYTKYRQNVADCIETLINNNEIDIVEFAEYGNEAYIWSQLKRRVPMVIRLHGPSMLNRKTQKPINKFFHPIKYKFSMREIDTLTSANAITSASEEMTKFIRINFLINMNNIETIYNSIKYIDWVLPIKQKKSTLTIKIFSAGSVTEGKGYIELFEACRELNDQGYSIELAIAGKLGRLGRVLLKKSKNEMMSWLNILGAVPREELKKHYNESDISCFPSWWEPFGLVCIEAMAAGSLVIGSNKGGMAEIIEDRKDGFLIEPKNVEILKEKIMEVIALSEDQKLQIRRNAQRKVKEKFDSQVILYQQLKFYEKVISKFNFPDDNNFKVN